MDKTLPGLSDVVYDELTEKLTKKQQNRLKLGASTYLALEKDEKAKSGKRKSFSKLNQNKTVKEQKNRCKDCKKKSENFHFHHADRDRTNNSFENCEALCPNCHDKRHRKKKTKQGGKKKKWFSF